VPYKEPMFSANELKEAFDAARFVGPPPYGTELGFTRRPGYLYPSENKRWSRRTGITAALKSEGLDSRTDSFSDWSSDEKLEL
jgi:hypothetical protein